MKNLARFREFVASFSALVDAAGGDERRIFREGAPLLAALVSHDDWLPDEFAQEEPGAYRQYLLYCDPRERFSVVSFVWGPGLPLTRRGQHRCEPGDVDKVSPTVGDVHVVENALTDRASISIHVYGGSIGAVKRHVFDAATGAAKTFVSGYSSATLPNFWDRSRETTA